MVRPATVVTIFVTCVLMSCSGATRYLKGGIHKDLDPDLTISKMQKDPAKYRDKTVVMSVRFYKKSDLPCPLGDDFVNFLIMDHISFITLDRVWIKKENAQVLDTLKESDAITIKARVFDVDVTKNPNLEALEIVPN
jgi:hypothetical protein